MSNIATNLSFTSTAVTTMLKLTQWMTRGDKLELLVILYFLPSKSNLLQPFMVLKSLPSPWCSVNGHCPTLCIKRVFSLYCTNINQYPAVNDDNFQAVPVDGMRIDNDIVHGTVVQNTSYCSSLCTCFTIIHASPGTESFIHSMKIPIVVHCFATYHSRQ